MLVAGVDDAGRGAIVGPLIIAGVLLREEDLPALEELGVKDSKLLAPSRREHLALKIRGKAQRCHVARLSPPEIDKAVETRRKFHKLNRLEASTMARVIQALKPDVAYVDASDTSAERYKHYIYENLPFRVHVVSEHKADQKYPIVSAASIIAKVERDKAVQTLRTTYGPLGSGYVSDSSTMGWLASCLNNNGDFPGCVRKSWKPAKRLKSELKSRQQKLTE